MPGPIPSVEDFEHLSIGLPRSVGYLLDHPDETSDMEFSMSYSAQVRVLSNYRNQIHKLLREAVEWIYHKSLHPKLEGR